VAKAQGQVAAGFEGVREAFEENFASRGEVGAAVSVWRGDECLVDLVGGDLAGGAGAYTPDHLQLVFSATKGATAMVAHLLSQRGQLDLDAPVGRYWPEFDEAGKGDIPVSWLLCHKAGLPDTDRAVSYEGALAWTEAVDALAASAPIWEPGTQHGYHAITYGYLVGEVIRRATGRTLGEIFAEEVAGPLGLDFWIGLPEAQHSRVAKLIPFGVPTDVALPSVESPLPSGTEAAPIDGDDGSATISGLVAMLEQLLGPDNLIGRALCGPGGAFSGGNVWNDPALWRAEMGAANGITNARSLARLYASCVGTVNGVRLLAEDTLARATEVQVSGPDAVLMFEIPFGLGFMRHSMFSPFGLDGAFGHYGAGGAVGFADPESGIGFGYVMNQMQLGLAGDPRTKALIDATVAALR